MLDGIAIRIFELSSSPLRLGYSYFKARSPWVHTGCYTCAREPGLSRRGLAARKTTPAPQLATMSPQLARLAGARLRLELLLVSYYASWSPRATVFGFLLSCLSCLKIPAEGFRGSEPRSQIAGGMPPQSRYCRLRDGLGQKVITDHFYTAGKRASREARRRNRENSRFIGDKNPGYNPAARPCS